VRTVKILRETRRKPKPLLVGKQKFPVRDVASKLKNKLIRRYGAKSGPVVIKARHQFEPLLEKVSQHGTVLLKKHNLTKAVVLSFEEYTALTRPKPAPVDTLSGRYDALYDGMQTPTVRASMRDAFAASPEALGKSAVRAARQHDA